MWCDPTSYGVDPRTIHAIIILCPLIIAEVGFHEAMSLQKALPFKSVHDCKLLAKVLGLRYSYGKTPLEHKQKGK